MQPEFRSGVWRSEYSKRPLADPGACAGRPRAL